MGLSDMTDKAERGWLLVSVSCVGGFGTQRARVWRTLHSLGGHFLQPNMCLLPDRPEVACDVQRLLNQVRLDGGVAQMLRIAFTDGEAERQIIAEMNAAVDAEYVEVLDRLPAFFSELNYERSRGRVIFAEVEESEVDLERFRAWVAKIAARDYFGAQRGAEVRSAIDAAGEELAAFEAAALRAETFAAPANPEPAADVVDMPHRLHAVEEPESETKSG